MGKIRINLINQKFGMLAVLKRDSKRAFKDNKFKSYWLCRCECGAVKSVSGAELRRGHTVSCGCKKITRFNTINKSHIFHGKSNTIEYAMWRHAKHRAKVSKIPFELSIGDIQIPEKCPILGIPLFKGNREFHENSPSIDRFYPNIGYVKENIQIISYRANKIKNDASFKEFEAIYLWYKNEFDKRKSSCP